MISKFLKLCAITLLLVGCNSQDDNLSELIFMTQNGPIVYNVETASTQDEMSQGLMNRKELAEDSGMIFELHGRKDIAMWMKDTYIPLDMLFVNQKGQIVWVYKDAQPLSTRLIRPQVNEPLSAVIELNGGDLDKHGIRVGDVVRHKAIK